jgi:hypothetical protein
MFKIVDLYDKREMDLIREIVENHTRTITSRPNLKLEEYHTCVDEETHTRIGNKKLRVITIESARLIENLDGTKRLLSDNPGYRIGEVLYNSKESESRPEFYFRLVRPDAPEDVGPPHCDYWFHDAFCTGWGMGNTIKYWIPIVTEPSLNGLFFYPDAPKYIPFKIQEKGGYRRPLIDMPIADLGSPVLPFPTTGQALKFRDDVLHAGAPNKGQFTRVSLEITLVSLPR